MSRTQRSIVISFTLTVILLSALVGALLGVVSPYEWNLFLARIQGSRVVSVIPPSKAAATLYLHDAGQSAIRQVMLELSMAEHGGTNDPASVLILLTAEGGTVEMPLSDSGLALRMELVPGSPTADDEPEPPPPLPPAQVAER